MTINGLGELPEGWVYVKGRQLFDFVRGVAFNKEQVRRTAHDGYMGILRAGNLQGGGIQLDDLVFAPCECVSDAQMLRAGDLVIAMSSGSASVVGKVSALDDDVSGLSFGAFCGGIRPSLSDTARWLFHFFQTSEYRHGISAVAAGININNLRAEQLFDLDIPLPPLNEQRRIVAKIEALTVRSRKAREALEAIGPLQEQYRQSVLAAAFRGDLTADWRAAHPDTEPASTRLDRIREERRQRWQAANPRKKYLEPAGPDLQYGFQELPDGWTVCSVGEIAECLDRLRQPITREDRKPGPYPYYGANGVVDSVAEFIFDDELVLVTEDETFYGRTKPIAYRVSGKCWVNNHAHVLKAIDPIEPDFLGFALRHYNVLPWLSGTTARAKLTQASLNVLPIALPPLRELRYLTAQLRKTMSWIQRITAATDRSQFEFDELNQSILAKAFRGALVSQDPNDEPAAVLLERLRAERNGHDNGKPRTPGRRPRSRPAQ
jgi:type I restriction enzyme S subunit